MAERATDRALSGTAGRRPSKPLNMMNDEERLAALKEWAEEKKYVQPGEAGTLAVSGFGGVNSLALGGPLRTVVSENHQSNDRWAGQYDAPVGPPSYQSVQNGEGSDAFSRNPIKKWYQKRKSQKDAKRNASLPAYAFRENEA